MKNGVWMRICDPNGIEQSSVMVIGDYTLYMHSFEDDRPMLIEHEHEAGSAGANACAVAGLAKRLQCPDECDRLFAGTGAQLLCTSAAWN